MNRSQQPSKVAVVILNWNGAAFLKRFLPSVTKFSVPEWSDVIVADNGSTDNSKQVVEENFPTVSYLQLNQNYGFAEGYNQALKQINADYYLLLNSDVEVTEDWLSPMREMMDNDPTIGAIQPKIMWLDHPDTFEYAGAAGGYIDALGYPFCRGRILDKQEKDNGQYNDHQNIFWATGAAMLVRAKVWHALDGLDQDFWAHMEEIDLCWRMKNQGYQVRFCANSTVYHLGGGSLSYGSPRKVFLNFRNNLYLLFKNLPTGKLIPILFIRMILDGVAAIQFLVTGQAPLLLEVFRAHVHFYRNLGKLMKKRGKLNTKVTTSQHAEIYPGSIIFQFYLLKKKKFSDLNWRSGKN